MELNAIDYEDTFVWDHICEILRQEFVDTTTNEEFVDEHFENGERNNCREKQQGTQRRNRNARMKDDILQNTWVEMFEKVSIRHLI